MPSISLQSATATVSATTRRRSRSIWLVALDDCLGEILEAAEYRLALVWYSQLLRGTGGMSGLVIIASCHGAFAMNRTNPNSTTYSVAVFHTCRFRRTSNAFNVLDILRVEGDTRLPVSVTRPLKGLATVSSALNSPASSIFLLALTHLIFCPFLSFVSSLTLQRPIFEPLWKTCFIILAIVRVLATREVLGFRVRRMTTTRRMFLRNTSGMSSQM